MASDKGMAPVGRDERSAVLLVYGLYLVGILSVGGASLIGVIVAHLKAGDASGIWRGHYQYQIRTFWLGLATAVVAFLLLFVFVGWLVYIWLAVWMLVRTVKGLLRALSGEPIDDPETLLW